MRLDHTAGMYCLMTNMRTQSVYIEAQGSSGLLNGACGIVKARCEVETACGEQAVEENECGGI
jgi:hypothetical protein